MTGPTANALTRWRPRLPELQALVGPLLRSPAVERLAAVTFLGVLSPRFRAVVDCPLWPPESGETALDGSRHDHSVGVALLALDLARRLGFSDRGQRYAAAWGLTHDIATWPLSHTGEAAFSRVTGWSAHRLRAEMLLGGSPVPERYRLASSLRELGLDPVALVSLFDRRTAPADEELALLRQVVRSPLTPDTLEGMARCGAVFDVPVAPPEEILAAFSLHKGTVCLDGRLLPTAFAFWRSKATIYERFINRPDVVHWESAWAEAVRQCCAGDTLVDALERNEYALIEAVKRRGISAGRGVLRYKEPQEYLVDTGLAALPSELPVGDLWRVLRREPAGALLE